MLKGQTVHSAIAATVNKRPWEFPDSIVYAAFKVWVGFLSYYYLLTSLQYSSPGLLCFSAVYDKCNSHVLGKSNISGVLLHFGFPFAPAVGILIQIII